MVWAMDCEIYQRIEKESSSDMFSKFSSYVTPRFIIEAAGMILWLKIDVRKKPSSFLHCVGVPMMRNLVLSALNFSLQFFIQRCVCTLFQVKIHISTVNMHMSTTTLWTRKTVILYKSLQVNPFLVCRSVLNSYTMNFSITFTDCIKGTLKGSLIINECSYIQ